MLLRKANQTIAISYIKVLRFSQMSRDGSHDLLMMSMNLSDINTLNIKSADYCCIISVTSKSEAINVMHNVDLTKKAE